MRYPCCFKEQAWSSSFFQDTVARSATDENDASIQMVAVIFSYHHFFHARQQSLLLRRLIKRKCPLFIHPSQCMVDCVRTSERGVTDKKCLDGAGWSDVPSPRSLAAVAIPWQVIIPDDCAAFAHTAKRPYLIIHTFRFTIERVLYMSKDNFNQEIL